jgi:hypothetical protein
MESFTTPSTDRHLHDRAPGNVTEMPEQGRAIAAA